MRAHKYGNGMTKEEHRQRHQELHSALDELIADWINHGGGAQPDEHGRIVSGKPIEELLRWSHRQTTEPDHEP